MPYLKLVGLWENIYDYSINKVEIVSKTKEIHLPARVQVKEKICTGFVTKQVRIYFIEWQVPEI